MDAVKFINQYHFVINPNGGAGQRVNQKCCNYRMAVNKMVQIYMVPVMNQRRLGRVATTCILEPDTVVISMLHA